MENCEKIKLPHIRYHMNGPPELQSPENSLKPMKRNGLVHLTEKRLGNEDYNSLHLQERQCHSEHSVNDLQV